jgi:hypothetical protein
MGVEVVGCRQGSDAALDAMTTTFIICRGAARSSTVIQVARLIDLDEEPVRYAQEQNVAGYSDTTGPHD